MRLRNEQVERLQRVARRLGRTQSETSALLVEEGLRRTEFGLIDFRNSPAGRQAYVQGSTLAVWEVVMVAQDHMLDVAATAESLGWPLAKVQAALSYAAAFPEEIDGAIRDNDAIEQTTLTRLVPATVGFSVTDGGNAGAG
jgi:hypothetical protein